MVGRGPQRINPIDSVPSIPRGPSHHFPVYVISLSMSSTVHTFEVHGTSIKHWDPEAHRILWNTFVRVGLYSFACLGRGHLEVELERSNRGANVEGGGG